MPQPEINVVVPLYYLPAEAGGPDVEVDAKFLEEGYEAVNTDTIMRQEADGLVDIGGVEVWLMSTVEEAEAAREAFGSGARAAKLPNGNGVVMRTHNTGFEINLKDRRRRERTAGVEEDQVFGSWVLDHAQMLTMQNQDEIEQERATRAWAREVATMARHMGPEAVKQLQVDLESTPGAYVGFASFDIRTLEETHGIEFENEGEAHSILFRGSQKYENGMMMGDIEEYLMDRLDHLVADEEEPEAPAP